MSKLKLNKKTLIIAVISLVVIAAACVAFVLFKDCFYKPKLSKKHEGITYLKGDTTYYTNGKTTQKLGNNTSADLYEQNGFYDTVEFTNDKQYMFFNYAENTDKTPVFCFKKTEDDVDARVELGENGYLSGVTENGFVYALYDSKTYVESLWFHDIKTGENKVICDNMYAHFDFDNFAIIYYAKYADDTFELYRYQNGESKLIDSDVTDIYTKSDTALGYLKGTEIKTVDKSGKISVVAKNVATVIKWFDNSVYYAKECQKVVMSSLVTDENNAYTKFMSRINDYYFDLYKLCYFDGTTEKIITDSCFVQIDKDDPALGFVFDTDGRAVSFDTIDLKALPRVSASEFADDLDPVEAVSEYITKFVTRFIAIDCIPYKTDIIAAEMTVANDNTLYLSVIKDNGVTVLDKATLKDGALQITELGNDPADIQRTDNGVITYISGGVLYADGDKVFEFGKYDSTHEYNYTRYYNEKSDNLYFISRGGNAHITLNVAHADGTVDPISEKLDNDTVFDILDDGTVVFVEESTLYIYKDGDRTKISSDVSKYALVSDGTVYYISDGTLKLYDGKKSSVIDKDVTDICYAFILK